jgi:hypothetical protein
MKSSHRIAQRVHLSETWLLVADLVTRATRDQKQWRPTGPFGHRDKFAYDTTYDLRGDMPQLAFRMITRTVAGHAREHAVCGG